MSLNAPDNQAIALDRVEIAVEPWTWEFAATRRDEIDRHFAARVRRSPGLWNGRVLLAHRCTIENRTLRGACFEADYASFLAWRDWDFPDRDVFNVFSCAALCAADGAYLVGEMAPSTANAGRVYFPCGTPDLADISADGRLDLAGSVGRELQEETGLDIGAFGAESGWLLVRDGCYLALMKRLAAHDDAVQLRARILRHLASERRPEFCDIRIVRGRADFEPQMPKFVVTYLEKFLA
jgi:hypothetical protein